MSKQENVVIFGATGTLGTYLADELAELGYKVFATARRNVVHPRYKDKGIECVPVDIVSKKGFDALPRENVAGVVHIAGAMPSRMPGYRPQVYIDVNVTGTLNVLDYCRSAEAAPFIYMQSHSDVAGWWNLPTPIAADAPRKLNLKGDHAVYIITKNAALDLSTYYHIEYGLRTVALRLPTIYAYTPIQEMFVNGVTRPIAYLYLMQRARNGEPIEVWGNPEVLKDIVYVKDYTQIVIRAIRTASAQGIYNVGTGIGTSLREQVEGIVDVFSRAGKRSQLIYRPEKPTQTGYIYDISKTQRELGYKPRYNYRAALEDMKKEWDGDRFAHLGECNLSI